MGYRQQLFICESVSNMDITKHIRVVIGADGWCKLDPKDKPKNIRVVFDGETKQVKSVEVINADNNK